VEVRAELAVELHATLLVSRDRLEVVGELVPGVQMGTRTRSDLRVPSMSRIKACSWSVGICRGSRELQPIVGREATVGLAGAGVGGRGAIAGEHLAGAPTGDAHQIHLVAAGAEPLVGEGVAEHVRV
jgi:hypothetical protein